MKVVNRQNVARFTFHRPKVRRRLFYFCAGVTSRSAGTTTMIDRGDVLSVGRFRFSHHGVVTMRVLHAGWVMTRPECYEQAKS